MTIGPESGRTRPRKTPLANVCLPRYTRNISKIISVITHSCTQIRQNKIQAFRPQRGSTPVPKAFNPFKAPASPVLGTNYLECERSVPQKSRKRGCGSEMVIIRDTSADTTAALHVSYEKKKKKRKPKGKTRTELLRGTIVSRTKYCV